MKASILSAALIAAMATCVAAKGNPVWTHEAAPAGAPADSGPVVIGNYTFATSAWSQCGATCQPGQAPILRSREVRCIRRGSYNLALPDSFCPSPKPATTLPCDVPPCTVAASPTGTSAPVPIECQNGIVSDGARIYKANITIYSAGDCGAGSGICSGSKSTVLYPDNYKMQVDQAVRAGPIVLNWEFTAKDGTVLYSGEKVGQAQTDNSYIIANFEDMANPCDTVSKGRGVFAVTMNELTTPSVPTPNWLSVDPEYYSRQALKWYWPTSDFPAETPDMKLVMDVPFEFVTAAPSKLAPGTPAAPPAEKHVYGANPIQQKADFSNFMNVRAVPP